MLWYAIGIIALVVIIGLFYVLKGKPEPEALPESAEPKKLPRAEPKQMKATKDTGSPKPAAEAKPTAKKPAVEKQPEEKKKPEEKKANDDDKKVEEPKAKPEPKPEPAASSEQQAGKETQEESEQKAEAQAEQAPASQPEPEPEKAAVESKAEPEPAPLVGQKVEPTVVASRARDVSGLRKGLGKSRGSEGFFGKLAKLITGRTEIDPAITDELEEALITSDVGVATTESILERIREGLKKKELGDSTKVWEALRVEAKRILSVGEGGLTLRTKPTVVLMVGVNGSGKTTTIGKIATQLKASGRGVVLAAGDTFRAAAVQQLAVWGKRVGCDVVKGKDGADPGAVIFDAIKRGVDSGADVVLADTAGRLHTHTPLMDELKKVVRTMGKAMEGAPHEILLVIDATNGQNAVAQSRLFAEALPLTGIVLTKLDGTAKGGVILGICDELKVPVRYIGIGERADDLRPFDPDEFVEALLGGSDAEGEEAA